MNSSKLRALWGSHSTTMQLLIMQVLTAGTAFCLNILSSAVMAPDARGYMTLLVQITYVITVLSLLGIERPYAAARATSFNEAIYELHQLIRPSYVLLALFVIIGGVLFAIGHRDFVLPGFLILLYLAGNIGSRIVRTGYIASSSLPPFMLVSIGTQLVLLTMGVLLFIAGNADPFFWFLTYGVSGLVAVVVTVFAVAKAKGSGLSGDDRGKIRRNGIKLLPASFGNTAMLRSDRLLLPALASTSQLGLYVVVATMMELASWPVQNWVDASLRKWKNGGAAKSGRWTKVAQAVLVALVLAGVMGIGCYALIIYVFSEAYAGSAALIVPLGVATIIYAASRVQQGLLIAAGRAKSVSAAELIGMVISVSSYVLLIPSLGALGAALGSIAGYLCCFLAGMFFLAKRYPRHVRRDKGRMS